MRTVRLLLFFIFSLTPAMVQSGGKDVPVPLCKFECKSSILTFNLNKGATSGEISGKLSDHAHDETLIRSCTLKEFAGQKFLVVNYTSKATGTKKTTINWIYEILLLDTSKTGKTLALSVFVRSMKRLKSMSAPLKGPNIIIKWHKKNREISLSIRGRTKSGDSPHITRYYLDLKRKHFIRDFSK